MKKEFKTLSDEIELWKLKFGISASQSSKFKELNNILKEFIRLLKEKVDPTQLNIIDILAGDKLINMKE